MVSKAIAPGNVSSRPYVMKAGSSVLSDFADGGAVYGYPGEYYGRVYYVNNITGDSTYDGLSWDTPFDEVSTAITASETYRAAAYTGSTNDYQRNIIYVAGTATAYGNLTALPNYCDIIGLGSNPRGNGCNVVTIDGVGVDAAAGSCRGLYLKNLNFEVSGEFYAMDVTLMLRSTIDNCVFQASDANGTAAASGAFRTSGAFAGNTIVNSTFGITDGTYACTNGFEQSGGVGNNNWFENNIFFGIAYPVKMVNTTNDNGTIWKNNYMHSHLGETEPTKGSQFGANCILVGNYMVGGDTAVIHVADAQMIANIIQDGGASSVESST